MDAYLGEIRLLPYRFAPDGWVLCEGQILDIETNPKLFAAIGTAYGGDGVKTFALPDLRGRVMIGTGTNGDESYAIGDSGGLEEVALTVDNMAPHSHDWPAWHAPGSREEPAFTILAELSEAATEAQGLARTILAYAPTTDGTALSGVLTSEGLGQPRPNMQPFLVLNHCIAIREGISEAEVEFLGEIRLSTAYFVPMGWRRCDGASLSIAEFPELFSLFGTTFGGDGVATFKLPDLRGRIAVGVGTAAGGKAYVQGTAGGAEHVTLSRRELPSHSHNVMVNSGEAVSASPVDAFLAAPQHEVRLYSEEKANTKMRDLTTTGMYGIPLENYMPSVGIDYFVAVHGAVPKAAK